MDRDIIGRLGAGVCKTLDATGFVPDDCQNIDGRVSIGVILLAALFFGLLLWAWKRFL